MHLIVEPTGGLANRLRTLDAALALGVASGVPTRLRWNVNRDLGGAFQQFFELPSELAALENVPASATGGVAFRLIAAGRRRLYRYLDDARVKRLVESGADFGALVRGPRPVYVRSCYRFFASERPYAWLQPIARLRASIDRHAGGFGAHTLGVHVRRTDHSVSRERSPDGLFFAALDQAIERDDRTEFCFCTDDAGTLRRFRDRYGRRVISRELQQFGRDSAAAIEEAVIDVFSLARCSRIFGSEWSSFSRLAAQLGGIERCVLAIGETRDTPALWGPLV
jgi:hypothetical protein